MVIVSTVHIIHVRDVQGISLNFARYFTFFVVLFAKFYALAEISGMKKVNKLS